MTKPQHATDHDLVELRKWAVDRALDRLAQYRDYPPSDPAAVVRVARDIEGYILDNTPPAVLPSACIGGDIRSHGDIHRELLRLGRARGTDGLA